MHAQTLQWLLAVAALAWVAFPAVGAVAFLAGVLLLVGSALAQGRRAGLRLEPARASLEGQLSAEAFRWLTRHATFYVDPAAAATWSGVCAVVVVISVLVVPALVIRALVTWDMTVFWTLPVDVVSLAVTLWVAARLDPAARVNSKGQAGNKALHDEVSKVLGLRAVAGGWPPP